jgi:hypothetical protein
MKRFANLFFMAGYPAGLSCSPSLRSLTSPSPSKPIPA